MRASSSASSGGTETWWSMKCAMPAARAPGTSVSPSDPIDSASSPFSMRYGTPFARASRAVSHTVEPPTLKASAPSPAPRMKSLLLFILPPLRGLRLARIHQDERDAAGLLAEVHPRVIGRLLHHHVTRLEMHHAVVEQHVDLAGQDDRVVEAARAMHHRVRRRP